MVKMFISCWATLLPVLPVQKSRLLWGRFFFLSEAIGVSGFQVSPELMSGQNNSKRTKKYNRELTPY